MECLPDVQCSVSFVEELYTNYKTVILSVVARYIEDRSFQEDVFHDIFIRILKKEDFLSTLSRPKLETYLLLMARGVSVDFLRRNHLNKRSDLPDDIIMELVTAQRRSFGAVESVGKVELAMMLKDISNEDLTLLIGKYYLDLEAKELANICGITSTAVRSRIHRAKKRLLSEWKKNGLNMGDFIDG